MSFVIITIGVVAIYDSNWYRKYLNDIEID